MKRSAVNKIFGIGWAKTGTTTLGRCFRLLGFDHQTHRFDLVPDLATGDLTRIFEAVEDGKSFEDWPWLLLYKELDERFPGSKFVLTTRDPERWLKSYRGHLARIDVITEEQNEQRRLLYGLPFPDVTDEQLLERYRRHHEEVATYFAGRSDDLIRVNWETGDGWGELCGFLGVDPPQVPFPHAHQAPARRTALGRLRAAARRLRRSIR